MNTQHDYEATRIADAKEDAIKALREVARDADDFVLSELRDAAILLDRMPNSSALIAEVRAIERLARQVRNRASMLAAIVVARDEA